MQKQEPDKFSIAFQAQTAYLILEMGLQLAKTVNTVAK